MIIGLFPALFVLSSAMAVVFGVVSVFLTALESGLLGVAVLAGNICAQTE
jgi:hypothetical protein